MGMWREYYRIGVPAIDHQHMQLFSMVDDLLKAIELGAGSQKIEYIIRFLKEYVVKHFNDEEAYQDSINYSGRAGHKIAHKIFKKSVLSYEKRLIESDYDEAVVKNLAGMLTTWLIYHVADADQRIIKGEPEAVVEEKPCTTTPCMETVCKSLLDVLQTMMGLEPHTRMCAAKTATDVSNIEIIAEVGIIGDIKGKIFFGFSRSIAFALIEKMTFIKLDNIDELTFSALGELANIASGNATIMLSSRNLNCDITTPVVGIKDSFPNEIDFKNGTQIDTPIGNVSVMVRLDKN